jgi:hypothetical protein
MRSLVVRALALAVCALAVPVMAGCGPKQPTLPTINGTHTTTAEPTTTVEEPLAEVSTGQITTPASGTALRKAVLKAAANGLGASGTLTVNQLFVQGGAAVGDVTTASGSRSFFALTGGPEAWNVVWSAPFGSTRAKVEKLLDAAPEASPELAAKLDFSKTTPKPVKAPSLASFKSFALKSAQSMAAGSYDGTFTVNAKIARDGSGEWWGNALLEPSDEDLEWIGVWGHYAGGKWTGQIAEYSEEDADAGFFPPEVLSALRF